MTGILTEISRLGLSLAYFTRRSGLSVPTLKRIDEGDPNVRPATLAKAERTLAQLRIEADTTVPTRVAQER